MATKSVQSNKETDIRQFLEKIVVNAGVGRLSQNTNFEDKVLPQVLKDIATVTGQKPQVRPSRKSIAGFKMREGTTVGIKVTLRGKKMVDFFSRLVTIVLPRVRDFRGVSLGDLDHGGTLNLGFREQFVFPEINAEESTLSFSLGVNLVPKLKNRVTAEAKFKELGIPFSVEAEKVFKRRGKKKK